MRIFDREIGEHGISVLTEMPGSGWRHLRATVQEDEKGMLITFGEDGVVGAFGAEDLAVYHEGEYGTVVYSISEMREFYEYAKQFDDDKFLDLMREPVGACAISVDSWLDVVVKELL